MFFFLPRNQSFHWVQIYCVAFSSFLIKSKYLCNFCTIWLANCELYTNRPTLTAVPWEIYVGENTRVLCVSTQIYVLYLYIQNSSRPCSIPLIWSADERGGWDKFSLSLNRIAPAVLAEIQPEKGSLMVKIAWSGFHYNLYIFFILYLQDFCRFLACRHTPWAASQKIIWTRVIHAKGTVPQDFRLFFNLDSGHHMSAKKRFSEIFHFVKIFTNTMTSCPCRQRIRAL